MFSVTFIAQEAESVTFWHSKEKIILGLRTVFCPLPLQLQAVTETDCRMSENHLVHLDFCQAFILKLYSPEDSITHWFLDKGIRELKWKLVTVGRGSGL